MAEAITEMEAMDSVSRAGPNLHYERIHHNFIGEQGSWRLNAFKTSKGSPKKEQAMGGEPLWNDAMY